MFSEKTRTVVLFTLAMAEVPLSIDDISFRTGLGYNTVKRVVFADPKVTAVAGRPTKYVVSMPAVIDPRLFVVEYDKPQEGWVEWLNAVRPFVVSLLAVDDSMEQSERDRKAKMFRSLATSFLSIANDLEDTLEEPDWFERLRGLTRREQREQG